jgi:hypothetical protein
VLAWRNASQAFHVPTPTREDTFFFTDPGRRRDKAPARPWATLLRPLRGLDTIFIRGGEREKLMGHFYEDALR